MDHLHVVMLPYMAHGHLTPFLALATQIIDRSNKNISVTIANTSLNIRYLRSTISSSHDADKNHHNHLFFAELPFSGPNENTENVPPSKIVDMLHSSSSLELPFRRLLHDIAAKEGRPVLCIITDMFFGWATDVAKSVGTLNFTFTTCGAYGTLATASTWLHLPHRHTNSHDFVLPGFPERCRFHRSQLNNEVRDADGTDLWSKFMQPQISLSLKSHGWFCNTVEEIEPLGLESLRSFLQLPVWAVGCCPSLNKHSSRKDLGIPFKTCLEWLNEQRPESVVYVSFGSQNTIGSAQMMELAKGLEKSGKPFIWVVRPPLGFDIKEDFQSEWLPESFEKRMAETKQGLIVKNWAPQMDILSHKSTRLFLSHCGWNSVIESLSQGVPIVAWPLAAEQAYNSKMLVEEMGVCLELTRGSESCVKDEDVKRVIELAMDGEAKGREIRMKVSIIKEQIKNATREEGNLKGSSVKALDDFLSFVQTQISVGRSSD
ncbi:UDP-glycosyltransferase 92A1-like [Cannabis sativa]|uniref:UDP-glycosyltransferase 92A1-like n=1 Tax=Cannabis sativa TaxID=3483 RepID=UPI0029C9F400|nr:UDP-glycosyltransferase 92A1-like [Cannabis sativa]